MGDRDTGFRLGNAEYRMAVTREPFRDGLADAATGSGNEGDARSVREMHRPLM